jgi:hypothetical protein
MKDYEGTERSVFYPPYFINWPDKMIITIYVLFPKLIVKLRAENFVFVRISVYAKNVSTSGNRDEKQK